MLKRIFLTAMCILMLSTLAFAGDVLLNTTVQSTVVGFDKNGEQYVRLIIQEQRTLQGISYEVGVPVMAFRENLQMAKAKKKGDTLKAIVQSREFQGRKSYTIVKIIE